MNKSILSILALTTAIIALGVITADDQPNDTIKFAYCFKTKKPEIFSLDSVTSTSPMKKGQDTTFVFKGTILKEQYLKYSIATAKMWIVTKKIRTELNDQAELGPFTDQLDVSLQGAIKGTLKITVNYYDANDKIVDCTALTATVN
jgi:hypothetical protein